MEARSLNGKWLGRNFFDREFECEMEMKKLLSISAWEEGKGEEMDEKW